MSPLLRDRSAHFMYQRTLCEKSLHEFVKAAWHVVEPDVPFRDSWHIQGICAHLESCIGKQIKQLLINCPPGVCKSLLVCVFLPAWAWIRLPHLRFMFASYADSLSLRDSMRCRNIITSEWYQTRWPLKLKEDQNTKGLYENERGGWRLATSVGGRATGLHPDVVGCDDLLNAMQANSAVEIQAVNEWWDSTMATRGISRDVVQIGIMQRLHANDWSAHVLSKGTWEHIVLPMRFEPGRMKPTSLGWNDPRTRDGELLWPELFSEERVAAMEASMGNYHAASQLQQSPAPRGGGMFHREWFTILPVCPPLRKIVRYWDKAGSLTTDAARTAGVLMAEYDDPSAGLSALRTKYIILDVIAGRWEAAEREAVIKQTAYADQAKYGFVEIWSEQEPGSGGKESAQSTVANLVGFSCKIERVTGAKEVRADPLASQSSVGKVKLLAGAFNKEFLDELCMFPVGKLKDQVDAASGAFNKLWQPGGGIGSAAEIYVGSGAELAESPAYA